MSQPKSFPMAEEIPPGFWEIGVADLSELGPEVRVIDVRELPELAQLPALEGAEHAPMSSLQPVIDEWSTDAAYVIVCAGGVRSANVALYMQQKGFADVVSLRGGMMDYAMRRR